jgi:hypothetical protein
VSVRDLLDREFEERRMRARTKEGRTTIRHAKSGRRAKAGRTIVENVKTTCRRKDRKNTPEQ